MADIIRVPAWRRRPVMDHSLTDPREIPLYQLATAAAIVGVPRGTLRHWAKLPNTPDQPVIELADPYTKMLSFSNLLEAHILLSTKRKNIPLVNTRNALRTLRDRFPQSKHPLLEHELHYVAGCRDLFIKELSGEIINASREGTQLALRAILEKFLKRIKWDQSGPVRLFPVRSDRIMIDLNISSAQPVVKGTGVLASIIASRNRAGDSVSELARDYRLKRSDVEAAIRFVNAA